MVPSGKFFVTCEPDINDWPCQEPDIPAAVKAVPDMKSLESCAELDITPLNIPSKLVAVTVPSVRVKLLPVMNTEPVN